jgi:hypothetical protein
MAHPFQRRTSHIRVVVTGEERVIKTPATVKKAAAKQVASKEAK